MIELSPDIEETLERYLELQADERRIKEEKKQLQNKLASLLGSTGIDKWYPEVKGKELRVTRTEKTIIDYDEDLLRSRLGERFNEILVPDNRKLAKHENEARELLKPLLEAVGKIDREQVKRAIEGGVVRPEEFSGAFKKEQKPQVAVAWLNKPREE